MYLAEVNIWNFRKYGYVDASSKPALQVKFNSGLNVLIGENDAGKTTIVDAIKLVLGTKSHDNLNIQESDFYVDNTGKRCESIKIECVFKELSEKEAGNFLEWINFDEAGNAELQVRLVARNKDNRISYSIDAGLPELDSRFQAIELLRVTYLKPLRDAENELKQGYHSRLAQILTNHPIFKQSQDEHTLEKYFSITNKKIEEYFQKDILDEDKEFGIVQGEKGAKEIIQNLDNTLGAFMGNSYSDRGYSPSIKISKNELSSILRRLSLVIADNQIGLGSLNQLFIALELLLFDIENKYNLALIEEIEAHLHPQAQLRLIEYIQEKKANSNLQFIITTHSITLASKIKLDNLIYCKDGVAYSLASGNTGLKACDYKYLERFLDATKANLFFARGILFVEGDAENLLIPVIAKRIGLPLENYGVSVVNVGSLAFLRYTKIFKRADNSVIDIPLSIVTDLDIRPDCYYADKGETNINNITIIKDDLSELEEKYHLKLSSIRNQDFLNKEELFNTIKEINSLDNFNNYRGIKGELEKYIEEVLNTQRLMAVKIKDKQRKYCTEKAKLYTNTWTLEYDIALSGLREYLYAAICIAKKLRNNEEATIDILAEIASAKTNITRWSMAGDSNELIAYRIYKDLLNKNASKAITAQYFSEMLESNSIALKSIIESDTHISYLADAIKHACRQEK